MQKLTKEQALVVTGYTGITALLLTLLLSGCFYQTTNQNDIQTAVRACGSLEQVHEIRADALGKELVVCTNRKIIWLDETVYAR